MARAWTCMPAQPLKFAIKEHHLQFRLAKSRLPFHFGMVTLREAWQMTLAVTVEDSQGRRAVGVAGDTLAPRWFDKNPDKSIVQNLLDLADVALQAGRKYTAEARPLTLFDRWQSAYHATLEQSQRDGLPDLVGSYGSAVWERALWSALARLVERPFYALLGENPAGMDLGLLHPELAGMTPQTILPAQPLTRIAVRHTIGGVDPLTRADDCSADPKDGRPYTFEENIRQFRLRYFKLKIFGDVAKDFMRLRAIAGVLNTVLPKAEPYHVTIDGNESYRDFAAVEELVGRLRAEPALAQFCRAILFIEQPLHRDVSFDEAHKPAIVRLSRFKPVIIDEADQNPGAFRRAAELGYAGVSAKNCKGVIKSLANKALITVWNRAGENGAAGGITPPAGGFVQSGEDLTNLPVVPLQQDLATLAALGIPHAERNGHHYYAGAGHLPAAERAAAQRSQGSLYEDRTDGLFVRIQNGALDVSGLNQPGYGMSLESEALAANPAGSLDLAAWRRRLSGEAQ